MTNTKVTTKTTKETPLPKESTGEIPPVKTVEGAESKSISIKLKNTR